MTNAQVVQAWAAGKAGKAGNLSTDGVSLWSYRLQIGDTMLSGRKVVYDYGWVSQTTSRHVGLAKRFA
jgi:hypothetical protein